MKILVVILVLLVLGGLLLSSPLTKTNAQPGGYGYGYYTTRIHQLENAHELDMQKIQELNDAMDKGQTEYEKLLTLYDQLKAFVELPNPVTFKVLSDILQSELR